MQLDALRQLFDQIQSDVAGGPILPTVTVDEVRAHLATEYQFQTGRPLDAVVADVERMLREWQVQVTHPRYLGLFNPSVTFPSVVAETLVASFNSQLANWRTSPAGNEIERHTLSWLAGRFGLPAETIATFTSGGSEANLSALVVGLAHAFPEIDQQGLRGLAATPIMYLSGEAHHGFYKLAQMAGLGRQAVRAIPTDANLKLDVAALRDQVARDRRAGLAPWLVVGSAGTTATGVIDPLPEIADFCREQGLWFHVDAAWGGAAALAPSLRHFLAGIEHADSVTCDAHKWLSVPMGCGMFFCRHPESVARAFHSDVTYVSGQQTGPVFNPLAHSAQWSRRFIGLRLFLALANLGEAGYAAMLEHQTRLGHVLRAALQKAGWEILNDTPLPLVCFTRPGLDSARLLAAVHREQLAWLSETTIHGRPVIRACITNYQTTEPMIHDIVAGLTRLHQQLDQQTPRDAAVLAGANA